MRVVAGGADGCIPFVAERLLPFGVLPTELQLGSCTPFRGRGVTLALVDSGFFPHPDLTGNVNRVRAWADTSSPRIQECFFNADELPHWPGWDERRPAQWHGLMTAAAAAGSGATSHGWYRGYAPEAALVFVQTWDENGRITNDSLVRALRWLLLHRELLQLRIVNLSLGGDPVRRLAGNVVDQAVRELVEAGVVVVAAAGNGGRRRVLPPATARHALTVGGLDTRNSSDPRAWRLWHGNWGRGSDGSAKPDLLAPAVWMAAPVLPGSATAAEGQELFAQRRGDEEVERRIAHHKFLTPSYQHVDGTSFAAAVVSGAAACLLEAQPDLAPQDVYDILNKTARPLPDVPRSKQGAGVIRPAAAVARVGK
ncbi:MAG: S8 family serine peptidase [Gemmataceae bacterium]